MISFNSHIPVAPNNSHVAPTSSSQAVQAPLPQPHAEPPGKQQAIPNAPTMHRLSWRRQGSGKEPVNKLNACKYTPGMKLRSDYEIVPYLSSDGKICQVVGQKMKENPSIFHAKNPETNEILCTLRRTVINKVNYVWMDRANTRLLGGAATSSTHFGEEQHALPTTGATQTALTPPKAIPMENGGAVPLQVAKQSYAEHRCFHGTTREGKRSIQEVGFKKARKTPIHIDPNWPLTEEETIEMLASRESIRSFHWMTQSRPMAQKFAELTADTENYYSTRTTDHKPAMVRLLLDKEKLESLVRFGDQLKSKDDIPQENVLSSKQFSSGRGYQVIRDSLNKQGYRVSDNDAKSILNEVQSDSEDDGFPR
jgi:hypothetical protein